MTDEEPSLLRILPQEIQRNGVEIGPTAADFRKMKLILLCDFKSYFWEKQGFFH